MLLDQKKTPKKPNVIYLFTDEHRYQSMSFTETPELLTPNLERLAASGMSFSECISNNPVCVPARGILMSGRWCYQTGLLENSGTLSYEEDTIGKSFQGAGYTTGYIGKWHLGGTAHKADQYGFNFARVWSNTNEHWASTYLDNGKTVLCNDYSPIVMTDQALGFIEDNKDNPFFIMVSYNPPHANFTDAPESYKKIYSEKSPTFRDNVPENIRLTN